MISPEDKSLIDKALRQVISLLRDADDKEIPALLGDDILDDFLQAIAKPLVALSCLLTLADSGS
jgi:hypothetical protein